MIIPWLLGFRNRFQAPLTWTLILANIFIFMMTYEAPRESKHFSTVREITLTGRLYYQYLLEDIESKSNEELILLGSRGLRDPQFLDEASTFEFEGDPIAISQWRQNIAEFKQELQSKPSHFYGLLTDEGRPLTWITYQFMHAGLLHLFSNMLLLLIFGGAFEARLGSFRLVGTFLLGGIAGGLGFVYWGGHSVAPMVGASGSLSAVMAAYAIAETKKRVGFFYLLSPIQGYFGVIYLPTLLIFPLCFVADLAGYLATPTELGGGIAYAAHLGGAFFGIGAGLSFRLWDQYWTKLHSPSAQIRDGAYSRSRNGVP
jgi:membrane associated rhomboid family serine protease